jgi:A/G-specific adenine glycosylase
LYTRQKLGSFKMSLSTKQSKWFSSHILAWYTQHGRKHLPWQQKPNAYRIWVSEIMLQQTQVVTVIPYFNKFMERFPSLKALADATEDEVLQYWAGLGYYARGRNLLKAAKLLRDKGYTDLPNDRELLNELPGIGRSTAAAIVAAAYGTRAAILDGNVKRVLTRFFAIPGWPDQKQVSEQLWNLSDQLTPAQNVREYNQAMMDLGATLCVRTKPQCGICPLQSRCAGLAEGEPTVYPHKKPTKQNPLRRRIFLIVENAKQEILLERRPPTGIWGGLWSFPEFEEKEHALDWLEQQLAIAKFTQQEWPILRHQFSHFTLEIVPLHIVVKSHKPVMMSNAARQWQCAKESLNLGLATPIKRLLEMLV